MSSKTTGASPAHSFDHVTVLFTDFKDSIVTSEKLTPQELAHEINVCFKAFNEIITRYAIEKIKTIGDAYMAASGLNGQKESAIRMVQAALEMQSFVLRRATERKRNGHPFFEMRIGLHTGPVVAGIVGVKKFQYDIWGDTVNTASRMESHGEVGQVNLSPTTYELVRDHFTCTPRQPIHFKGKGEIQMYFVKQS